MYKRLVLVLIGVFFLVSISCSFKKAERDEEMPPSAPKPKMAMAMRAESAPTGGAFEYKEAEGTVSSVTPMQSERKMIFSADIRIEVKNYEESFNKVKEIVEGIGGYIADSRVTEETNGRKSGDMILKVPQDKFEGVLKSLSDLGRVKDLAQHGLDVTEEYFDLEIRLNNAKKMEVRLLDLLENKSQKLKDMLDVEKEMGRVREEIERFEGKKRFYDNRISFSTIVVNLFEPQFYSTSIFDPVFDAFKDAGGLFMSSLGSVVKFISAALPWLVLLFIFVWICIKVVKRWWRKFREKVKKISKKEGGEKGVQEVDIKG